MLNNGQIKFSKEAATAAKGVFERKKVSEFLQILNQKDMPSGGKDLYEEILGVKQNTSNNQIVYAMDSTKAKTFFDKTLLKDGRLSRIVYPKHSCVLYITKNQQSECDSLKTSDSKWPDVFLDDKKDSCVMKFESLMKTNFVNLPDLISSCSKVQESKPAVIKQGSMDDSALYERRKAETRKELEPFIKKSKDDMELLKIRRKEIKEKEVAQFLPNDIVKKLDMLGSKAENFGKTDVAKLKETEISQYIGNLRSFFVDIKSVLESLKVKSPMIEYVETMSKLLTNPESMNEITVDKVKKTIEQIQKETEKTRE
jgi:hypothetical protein